MITAVIITKNQQKELESCLIALSKAGIPTLVCDTGSSDGSMELAKSLGAKVVSYEWNDDFAAAKNYAASMADTDLILTIDTDETVEKGDHKRLLSEVKAHGQEIGRIIRRNRFSYEKEIRYMTEYVPRIYDRRFFEYEGRIHEQIVPIDREVKPGYYDSCIQVFHTGFDLTDEEKKIKAKRNLDLLIKEAHEFESKNGDMPRENLPLDAASRGSYIYYQIGKSHYLKGDYHSAAEAFSTGLSFDVDERLEYVSDMVTSYGYSLINDGRPAEALMLEGVADTFGRDADFVFVMGLILMQNARFDDAVAYFEKAATFSASRVEGASSYLAYYNAGVIRECQGMLEDAERYYKKCGSYEPAAKRLEAMK